MKTSERENEGHFYRLLNNSRIVIVTADFTTFKQCFFINHPTVMLWDKEYFKMRIDANEDYELLHKNKILHYDPIECANFVNHIYSNPLKWWMSHDVQKAKDNYLTKYVKETNNIEKDFKKLIKSIDSNKI